MAHEATVPAVVHEVLRSSGQPLDSKVRVPMEARFGHDFSRVRVHDGAKAAESARAINARAYTAGHEIVFAAGAFAPGRDAGERLLAHELTHVVQQSRAQSSNLASLGMDSAPAAEGEAERMASEKVTFPTGSQTAAPMIQRQMESGQPVASPQTQAREGEEKLGGDCTTACAALEAMRGSVQRLCDLAGEKDKRCIEARKKLGINEGRVIGMNCECALPIV